MSETYKHKNGGIVAVDKIEDGTVYFYPQGGGFSRKIPEETFRADFEPYEIPDKLVPGVFDIDYYIIVKGFYNPDVRWNGWVIPCFTEENFLKLFSSDINVKDIDLEKGTYYDIDQEETYEFSITEHDGQKLYSPDGWCWDVTEAPEPEEIAEHQEWLKAQKLDKSFDAFVQNQKFDDLSKESMFHLRMVLLDIDPWEAPAPKPSPVTL